MRDEDDEDLKLRDWAVPPPPADLVGRVMTQLEGSEDTSVGAPPRFVPMEPPQVTAKRAASVGALVVSGLIGAAAAAAAVVAVYESRESGSPEVTRDEPAPAPAPDPTKAPLDDEITHTVPKKHTPPTETRRFANESERRKAWERLVAARALREAGVTGAGGGGGGGGATTAVSKEDIQASVREVVPLLVECFEMAGEIVVREGGTLVAELIVGSEPDVGTIVEEASFVRGDAHMLNDPVFTECVHETLMSVEMPPLTGGGQLVIHYPFVFSSKEPEQTGDKTAKTGQYKYPLPDLSPKDAPQETPKAGEPEVDEMAHSEKSASELADDAAAAARAGQYGKALRVAEEALRKESGNSSARTTAAIAACNLKQADKAKLHISHLTRQRLGMVRQVCLRNNVNID